MLLGCLGIKKKKKKSFQNSRLLRRPSWTTIEKLSFLFSPYFDPAFIFFTSIRADNSRYNRILPVWVMVAKVVVAVRGHRHAGTATATGTMHK